MGKRIGMEVGIAAAEAVGLCNIDVAAVYPITPSPILPNIYRISYMMDGLTPNSSPLNRSIPPSVPAPAPQRQEPGSIRPPVPRD